MESKSDKTKVLEILERDGEVTSFQLRRAGISGNPSQRVRELKEQGHTIESERYQESPGRYGSRYWLVPDEQMRIV